MGGEQRNFCYVEFTSRVPKELPNGKTIHVPMETFYVKKGKETNKQHEAAHLSQELAEQIVQRYPGKNARISYDSTWPLKTTLVEVNEEDAPPPPPPSSIAVLEDAVRGAMRQLTKLEVMAIVNRVVLGEPVVLREIDIQLKPTIGEQFAAAAPSIQS
jgi:hypothetical protein